jgi:hypothetical protein
MQLRIDYTYRRDCWQRSIPRWVMTCVECGVAIDHRTDSYYVHKGGGPVCLRDGAELNTTRAARGEEPLPLQRT